MTTRRIVLTRSAAVIGAASSGLLLPQIVRAQSDKVRVGFMLPYTGTFAQLGVAIENGFRMALNEQGGKLGGRELNYSSDVDLMLLYDPAAAAYHTDRAGACYVRLARDLVRNDQDRKIMDLFLAQKAAARPVAAPRSRAA